MATPYEEILNYIEATATAPYGVLTSSRTTKNMRECKTITFGVARFLDATLEYYHRKYVRLQTSRGYGWEVYTADEIMPKLKELLG